MKGCHNHLVDNTICDITQGQSYAGELYESMTAICLTFSLNDEFQRTLSSRSSKNLTNRFHLYQLCRLRSYVLISLVVIPFPWKSLSKPFRHVRLIVSSLTIWYTGCYFFPWTFSVSSCCVYHFYYYFLLYLCHSLQFNFWARQIRLVLFRRLYFYLFDTVVSVWILVIQYHNISVSLCCVYRFHSCIHCGYSGWYFIHCSYISEHFTLGSFYLMSSCLSFGTLIAFSFLGIQFQSILVSPCCVYRLYS